MKLNANDAGKRIPEPVRLAIDKLHVGLGHCSRAALQTTLRLGGGSAVARQAAALHRCPVCERYPTIPPRPRAALPLAHEVNEWLLLDVTTIPDQDGNEYLFLVMADAASGFTVARLVSGRAKPSSSAVALAHEDGWRCWASMAKNYFVDQGSEFRVFSKSGLATTTSQ